ncbi:MAG: hypothetical protein Kow0042_19960 [Calditrichia bacterium]
MELILLLIILIGIIILVGFKIYENKYKTKNTYPIHVEQTNKPELIRTSQISINSPIKDLSFEEALDIQKFDNSLEKTALDTLNENFLKEFDTKNLSYLSNISSSVKKIKNGIIWEISDKGKKLLKTGKAEIVFHEESGKLLPIIKDAKTKKFIEQFKGKVPNISSKIANLTNVLVNCAHIISGADISKRINLLDKKVEYLIAGRKIDQLSRIEANYNLARELLFEPLSENDISTLKLLHKDNLELRAVWRREMELKLDQIEDPNNISWIKKIFSRQETRDKKVIKNIIECEFEKEIRLIDFSISFDLALCHAINNSNAFINTTLSEEVKRLNEICLKLIQKKTYIKEVSENDDVESVINYLKYVTIKYSFYTPVYSSQNIIENHLSDKVVSFLEQGSDEKV